jgi:hypothetical protein
MMTGRGPRTTLECFRLPHASCRALVDNRYSCGQRWAGLKFTGGSFAIAGVPPPFRNPREIAKVQSHCSVGFCTADSQDAVDLQQFRRSLRRYVDIGCVPRRIWFTSKTTAKSDSLGCMAIRLSGIAGCLLAVSVDTVAIRPALPRRNARRMSISLCLSLVMPVVKRNHLSDSKSIEA